MPVSGVPGGGSSRNPAAGDGRSVLSPLGVGAAAAPRSPVSGGVCGLVCVRYPPAARNVRECFITGAGLMGEAEIMEMYANLCKFTLYWVFSRACWHIP